MLVGEFRPVVAAAMASAPFVFGVCQDASATDLAFADAAVSRGLFYIQGFPGAQFGAGQGFVDLDGDHDLDVVVTGASNGLVGVYENLGAGTFANRTFSAGIAPLTAASGFSACDYDGDGDLDLYLGGWFVTNRLLRNNGNFTFTDVTAQAGLTLVAPSMASTWGDYNGDNWLDLYVTTRTATNGNMTANKLYRNNGDGTFTDVAVAVGVDAGIDPSLLAAFFDFDRDGDDDLYVGTDKGSAGVWKNRLYRNDGGMFTEITEAANAEAYIDCMGIAIGDLNFDGYFDLYLTNVEAGNKLFMNDGGAGFIDATAAAGMARNVFSWATVFADFNNDMHLDTYICHASAPNAMFQGSATWPLMEVAQAAGVATTGTSYAASVGDVDEDGDLDLLVGEVLSSSKLYINDSPAGNHWSRLRVIGQWPNTHAVGAVLEVQAGGVTQLREIHCGSNYKSMNEFEVHVGLGVETVVDTVTVRWPATGDTRVLTGVPANIEWEIFPPERVGDGNHDGRVTRMDLFVMLAALRDGAGPLTPGLEALDMNGDFVLDATDVAILTAKVRPIIGTIAP